MNGDKRHAGETANGGARGLANGGKLWRTVTTKNGKMLKSPDGRLYYGTAQEARDAALTPRERDALAVRLKFNRSLRDRGAFNADELAAYCMESRRDAIMWGEADEKTGEYIAIPTDTYIRLRAGARLVSDDFDAFIKDMFESQITALLDIAQSDTGKREIPLTRYERSALARYA